MAIIKSGGDFFALDIGTNAVRLLQLKSVPSNHTWDLVHYAYLPLDDKSIKVDTPEGSRKLGEIIKTAYGKSGIKTKDVVIGLPSSKTFTTVIDLPDMPEDELKSTIKYQIDQYIPMPVSETKYDFAVLGKSIRNPNQTEILISSVATAYTEEKIAFIESLGFNVLSAEPEGLAILRSLVPSGLRDARIVIDVGEQNTDVSITIGDTPRLVRNISTGIRTFIRSCVQGLNVQEDQARQFILKFGLASDKLEGHVFNAMKPSLDNFSSEITKSINFFHNRYPNIQINGIILAGYSALVPEWAEYITATTNINATKGNPWQSVNVSPDIQSQLYSISSEFAAVIGLAKRVEK